MENGEYVKLAQKKKRRMTHLDLGAQHAIQVVEDEQ